MKIPDLDKEKISYGKYYYFDNNTYTVDASGSEAELEYLCSDFTITKVIYNEDRQNFKYEMFLETPNGEKEVTVDKSVFTSRNLESLTVKGFSFNPDRTKEVLMLALLQEDDAEKITESSYIGFKNNYFWGYARDKDRKCISRVKLEQSKFFDKKQLNRLLNNAPLLQLAYTISASSAVQSFLGQELPLSTMLYHFYGDSSQGKTTALLTTSVWGKPTVESGLFGTWNQTELSLMNQLANNFGVTVALDESSICRFDLTSTLYNLQQGINRQRLQKDLQQQPTKQWLTTILSSGESSLMEHTNKNNGLKVRTVEFCYPVTLSAEHSNECKAFFLNNYGHTVREIVSCCKSDGSYYNTGSFTTKFSKLLKKLGLRHIRYHDLRHTNATLMMSYGIPIKVMSENLGHANTGVTMDTYSHVTPKMKEEVAEKFDDELFSKIG